MSPIPSSSMSACMRFVRKEHPEWEQDQRVAVCLATLRKAGKKVAPKKKQQEEA